MTYYVVPYNRYSRSAKALAKELGGKRVKLLPPSLNHNDVVINWGCKSLEMPAPTALLNSPEYLKGATDKLLFFKLMREKGLGNVIPPFWTSADEIPENEFPIVCRTLLNAHSGNGIVIADNPSELVAAPLYVKYIKKQDEYRIHVGKVYEFDNEGNQIIQSIIIAAQQKRRRKDCENPNWRVRNHGNGFIFARDNVNPPAAVISAARAAFVATELDFGAVDVIWNANSEKAYVLEINSAPGLEGTTVGDYANFFQSLSC